MKDLFLKKHGMEVHRELDNNQKRIIASQVAGKISGGLTHLKLDYFELFSCLYNTKMYSAEIPNSISSVIYSYKNHALYFSGKLKLLEVNEDMLFECIHRIQHDMYHKIGLCNTKTGKGLMLNEAANQYIVNKIMGNEYHYVEKYGLKMNTYSKRHHLIVSNLMEEIALLVGDKELINGTLMANNSFEKYLKSNFGNSGFIQIRDNFDKIIKLKSEMDDDNNCDKISQIKEIYYETQKIIYQNYYNFNTIYDTESAKEKLNLLKEKFANTEGYEQFLLFYVEKMNQIKVEEKKFTGLVVIDKNTFKNMFKKVRILNQLLNLGLNKSSEK